MLPRERVLTTLQHQEPDVIPWGEHYVDYNIVEDVLGHKTFYHAKFRETQAWWEGRREEIVASYVHDYLDLVKALDFDIVTVEMLPDKNKPVKPMTLVDRETKSYRDEKGNLYRVSSATHDLMLYQFNPAAFRKPTVETLKAEIDSLDKEGLGNIDTSVWDMALPIIQQMKNTHFIAILAPDIGWPSFGGTDEEFFLNLALHPEMHSYIAERNGKRAIAWLKHFADLGVDAVIPCADYGTSAALQANPKIFREHIFPWIKAYCEKAHHLGLKVLKHCCGNIWEVLDMFVEAGYDAYESIQASARMDIKRLKELYGDRLTLWGGVTNENLIHGTPDDVVADAQYAVKWAAPGGGFIYGASHSLAVGTPLENLMAMKQSRKKFGGYPIRVWMVDTN